MDLWESRLIYAPVPGPCRSARAPGEAKSWMGTGAAAHLRPPVPASCCGRGGTGAAVLCLGEFALLLKPSSGNWVFLLCLFLLVLKQSTSAQAPVPKRGDAPLGADFLTW